MSATTVQATTTKAGTIWKADPAHTGVGFSVRHMMISEVAGKFGEFKIGIEQGAEGFADSTITAVIKAASINTENNDRDNHLRSPDFFAVEQYPEITFASTLFKKLSDQRYSITGNLTIRGITKEVTFDARYFGSAVSPWRQVIAAFKAVTTIDRYDFDLKWNQALEAGGVLVGRNVDITLNVELIREG